MGKVTHVHHHVTAKERQIRTETYVMAVLWLIGIGIVTYGVFYIIGTLFPNTSWELTKKILWATAIITALVLFFRKRIFRYLKKKYKKKKEWERLREVPRWVPKKMKRRRSNRVNGDYYIYMRKNGKYYRKKKNG